MEHIKFRNIRFPLGFQKIYGISPARLHSHTQSERKIVIARSYEKFCMNILFTLTSHFTSLYVIQTNLTHNLNLNARL